jgi:IS1 family transposase
VKVKDVWADEIWTFVGKKEGHRNPDEAHAREIGDAYTFIALERHTKLILAWHLGKRTRVSTEGFIAKLRTATADSRFQISTDAFGPYVNAIEDELSDRADYSQVVKVYATTEDGRESSRRLSLSNCRKVRPQATRTGSSLTRPKKSCLRHCLCGYESHW